MQTNPSKRRAKLEGRDTAGLYRSSSGRIEIAYRVGGKLCWHSMPAKSSIAEARAKRAELTVQKKQGTLALPSKLILSQAVAGWLKEGATQWAPSTYSSREATMRIHVIPEIGNVRLRDLTDDHLWRVVIEMRSKKNAPSSIKLMLSQVAALLGYCQDSKQLSVIPTLSRRRRSQIGAGNEAVKVVTDGDIVADVPALLASAEAQWVLLLKTAALSGLRLAEVLGLRTRDIGDGVLHVAGQLDRKTRAWTPRLKTPSSLRDVVVPAGLTEELHAASKLDDPSALIFTAGNGEGLWAQVAERGFARAAKNAGLDESLTFHNLRHTAASRWIYEGRSVSFVQHQLGHKSPALTLSTYTHQWDTVREGQDAREAADAAYAEATPKPALKLVKNA